MSRALPLWRQWLIAKIAGPDKQVVFFDREKDAIVNAVMIVSVLSAWAKMREMVAAQEQAKKEGPPPDPAPEAGETLVAALRTGRQIH